MFSPWMLTEEATVSAISDFDVMGPEDDEGSLIILAEDTLEDLAESAFVPDFAELILDDLVDSALSPDFADVGLAVSSDFAEVGLDDVEDSTFSLLPSDWGTECKGTDCKFKESNSLTGELARDDLLEFRFPTESICFAGEFALDDLVEFINYIR